MENKAYMLCRKVGDKGGESITLYAQESAAAAECTRLNNMPKKRDVVWYVETWVVHGT